MKALLLSFLVACGSAPQPTTQPTQPPPSSPPVAGNEETFSGTITKIDFGCAADARCDLVLDNTKSVHFGHDTRREGGKVPFGKTDEIFTLMGEPNQGVGKRVEVFAAKEGDGYTLQGKADYYIKVLP